MALRQHRAVGLAGSTPNKASRQATFDGNAATYVNPACVLLGGFFQSGVC